jgi:transposase-like protein
VVRTPLSIVWPCALDVLAYAAAGQRVAVPPQRCPDCGRRLVGWSGYWRWARAQPGGERRLWIRRGRCPACRRSHALVPDVLLARRLDGVETVGPGLALAASGLGLRAVARRLGVPHTTARSWWRRFRARAPTLTAALVALAVGLDGEPVDLAADGAAAALAALAVAWGRARRRWGERVGAVWRFWSRVTGGRALATTTSAPLAGAGAAAWMAPSR